MTFTQQRPAVSVAAALAVAAMIALLAWSPLLVQRMTDAAPQASAQAFQPLGPVPSALGDASWYTTIPVGVPVTAAGAMMLIGRPAIEPGPYNPLIVQPPVRAVRTVSTRSAPN